jgi:ABC-2 type transport system permease protein
MKRILAQARKELVQTFRDRMTLALALVLPLIMLSILGVAISLSVSDLTIIVEDLDQSPLSRKYLDTFRNSLTFRVVSWPINSSPEKALENNYAHAAIIIPEHFQQKVERGENVDLQMLVDATDANTAKILSASADAITQKFLSTLITNNTEPPIQAKIRLWFNPGRESDKYIGPAVFAVVLALFPPLLAALAMSRESEQKTILQVYVSSISAQEYLFGKILAYTAISAAEWVLALILSTLLFDLRPAGDPTPLLVGTIFYLFCNASFGTMVGVIIPNQAAAIQAAQLGGFLASFLLSGFIFPLSNIPDSLRWLASFVPARYYIELSRDAFVRGSGWSAMWYAPTMLALLGAAFFFIAWRNMRRMQVQA